MGHAHRLSVLPIRMGRPAARSLRRMAAKRDGVGTGLVFDFELLHLCHREARLARSLGSDADLLDAIREGAVLRVRPKAMTVAVIIAGLVPIMFGGGTGSEVMQRIAAPMVGGMVTAPLLSMFVVPAIYWLMRKRGRGAAGQPPADRGNASARDPASSAA